MARPTLKGVQLPPDSTGKVTGGFTISVYDDSDGSTTEVTIPATVIVNADGEDIGGEILDVLGKIEDHLASIKESQKILVDVIGGQ